MDGSAKHLRTVSVVEFHMKINDHKAFIIITMTMKLFQS